MNNFFLISTLNTLIEYIFLRNSFSQLYGCKIVEPCQIEGLGTQLVLFTDSFGHNK